MQTEAYVQALREDLARVAAVGGDSTVQAAELLAIALESALGRRLQEALAEAALELSGQLPDGHVEVRVAGGDPELIYVGEEASVAADTSDAGSSARITLRLPESLKSRLEAAAAASGLSLNTWLVQALGRVVEPRSHSGGGRHRLSGYGRT